MTAKEKAALKRVAKKLSAMRATLNKNERIWLDRIVLGGEVTAHAATAPGKALRATQAQAAQVAAHAMTAPKKALRVTKDQAAQVAAHAMTATNKAMRVTRAQAAEVAAHAATAPQKALRVTRAQAAQLAAANAANVLEFDATTGGYRLNETAAI